MAVRKANQLSIDREENSTLVVGGTGQAVKQDGERQVFRPGNESSQADVSMKQTDVADGNWVLSDETDAFDGRPDVGGASYITIAANSSSGNTFKVTVEWYDEDGTKLYEDTATKEPDLEGTDVRVDTSVAGDEFDIIVEDTSGAADNNVKGSFNAH